MIADLTNTEPESSILKEGIGLCLSGGGYRAMLFHIGSIIRLNEGRLLQRLSRVSSVSGGSITAGLLGLNWGKLGFDDSGFATRLNEHFVSPLRKMASVTIDRGSVLGGVFWTGSVSDRVSAAYAEHLFGDATLQDLPESESSSNSPDFVITATSVQTGALVRLSKRYVADYHVGMIKNPEISLAQAVTASSAFPPVLSPTVIDIDPDDFAVGKTGPLFREPFNDSLVLTDGGVYDNLGLEPVFKKYKTVFVSDGGGKIQPEGEPAADWARHSLRVLDIIDNQVRSLRKRELISAYRQGEREGAFWGIRTNIADYDLADSLNVTHETSIHLANTPTRLKKMNRHRQEQLIDWGYTVTDAAIRKYSESLVTDISAPVLPFNSGIV